MKKYTLPLKGMTCASCVTRVEKVMNKFEDIKNVSVNFASEQVSFETSSIKVDEIAEAVGKYGYELDTSSINNIGVKDKKEGEDPEEKKLKTDLMLAVIFTLPVFVISMLQEYQFFKEIWTFSSADTNKILLLLTTPVVLFSGKRFFQVAWKNVKNFSAEMNTLVAVGTGSAYLFSMLTSLFPEMAGIVGGYVYFETAAVIITLILLGRWLEQKAKKKTKNALKNLLELKPKEAWILEGGREKKVKITDLKRGDIVLIRSGDSIPADGVITKGYSSIDESMLTGESFPVEKTIGNNVIGGTINKTGSFQFEITALGDNSILGQIISLVEKANMTKPPIQKTVDKVAAVFVPAVIIVAILTFAAWIIFSPDHSINTALTNFVAVLIIACPCALGLATPTAIIVGTGLGAKSGILIKNGESLELAQDIDTIVFDKTGTLTKGSPKVSEVVTHEISEEELLQLAGSLERKSSHPIAKAVLRCAEEKNIDLYEADDFEEIPGFGLTGSINNRRVFAGNIGHMQNNSVNITEFEEEYYRLAGEGKTTLFITVDGRVGGLIAIYDPVKDSTPEAIERLHKSGFKLFMLTGDNKKTAEIISQKLGIDNYEAEVLPHQKTEIIEKLQQKGHKVAMVGDGINDSPALTQANLGIAMGTGTDVAIESSDITLVKGDLMGVQRAIKLSRFTIKTIKQNLFWAFIYNSIGIPLAALGLLNPMIAALAMSFSSVSVVTNSLRLRKRNM